MNNNILLVLQVIASALAGGLIFIVYLMPRLNKLSFEQAVLPMLLLQVYRFTALTLLVSGQVDSNIPQSALSQIAWGDYASAVIALVAAFVVWRRGRLSVPLIWLFVVVTIVDLMNVTRIIFDINFFSFYIGSTWTFMMWYLPWLVISLFYILYRLLNKSKRA